MTTELWIEIERDGALVAAEVASAAPCIEDALFDAVVSGSLPNDGGVPEPRVTPLDVSDSTGVMAVLVELAGTDPRRYDREVFSTQARALAQTLDPPKPAADGLGEAETDESRPLIWQLVARPATHAAPRFRARTTRAPFPLRPSPLLHLAPGERSVRIRAPLLRRIEAEMARAGSVERAGLLLGTLRHDVARGAVELVVSDTAMLEPGAGGASSSHFAFDPRSFAAALRAVRARGGAEQPCGWQHSHPPCAGCALQPSCETDNVFFSTPDVQVHSAVFGSAFNVGLVVGKVRHLPALRPGFRLFGWSRGRVEPRTFEACGAGSDAWRPDEGAFGTAAPESQKEIA